MKANVTALMAGHMCGVCGKFDGEHKQGYQTPSDYLAKDEVSFAQSWMVPDDSCSGSKQILQARLLDRRKPFSDIGAPFSLRNIFLVSTHLLSKKRLK